jgi:hypothetical protein
MAPTNEHTSRRGNNRSGAGSGPPYRSANTSAGVNRYHSSAVRNARRARDNHRWHSRIDLNQPPVNAPTGLSLASRMTFADRRGRNLNVRGGTADLNYSDATRPRPQAGRRLQDRITRAEDTSGGESRPAQRPLGPTVNNNTATNNIDNTPFQSNDTQASALFCDSQPTRSPNSPFVLPARSVAPPRPIRMVNQLVAPTIPKRLYGGSDPVKRAVSNPKLRAILSDKPLPKERRKYVDERMELRLGGGRVMK